MIAEKHLCHATGCKAEVPPKLLMCAHHWRMVPEHLKDQVWAKYRAGQEIDKKPSGEYLAAAKAAIDAVETREASERSEPDLFSGV